jgi:hypothetical protein
MKSLGSADVVQVRQPLVVLNASDPTVWPPSDARLSSATQAVALVQDNWTSPSLSVGMGLEVQL